MDDPLFRKYIQRRHFLQRAFLRQQLLQKIARQRWMQIRMRSLSEEMRDEIEED
jgi:hypothetical protein